MRRGTTPTITIEVDGISLYDCTDIEVTFKQDRYMLNKRFSEDEVELDRDNNVVIVRLTQEETLQFKPTGIYIQIKVKDVDGGVGASDILVRKINDILDESVM